MLSISLYCISIVTEFTSIVRDIIFIRAVTHYLRNFHFSPRGRANESSTRTGAGEREKEAERVEEEEEGEEEGKEQREARGDKGEVRTAPDGTTTSLSR